jgi:hypothetical protein
MAFSGSRSDLVAALPRSAGGTADELVIHDSAVLPATTITPGQLKRFMENKGSTASYYRRRAPNR